MPALIHYSNEWRHYTRNNNIGIVPIFSFISCNHSASVLTFLMYVCLYELYLEHVFTVFLSCVHAYLCHTTVRVYKTIFENVQNWGKRMT